MAYNKGVHSSSGGSHRGRPYVLVLLITFGIALLGVMVLHKLRERRICTLLVKEKDQQILALQLLLQKERDRSKELRSKNEEMKGKLYTLRSQKMELARTVGEMQSTLDSLKDEQKLMESAFEEQQNELRSMQEKGKSVAQGGYDIEALRDNLKHKEEELEDLKRRLETPVNDHPTIFNEIVTANGTIAAQDEIEKDENSGESAKHEGDNNEGASKSELTKFKDGEVATEMRDGIRTDGDGATKDMDDAEVVDGREKKAMREEHAGQVENNTDGGGRVKQLAGTKRKHSRASRMKGKRWRTTVKNSSMENNGVFENHSDNRKVYKDELKGRRVGKVSNEENFAREDEGRNNNSQRKEKPHAKLLKTENHESKEDANDMKVNNTKHQVTNSGSNIYSQKILDEIRQSEENEQSQVQENWNKGHINKVDRNAAQTKSKVLLEGLEELKEVLDVQKQEKDSIDSGQDDEDNDYDFFKELHSEFEDEKDEYKGEIDESEFQTGL
ncbi:hypothetical protein GLYMA_06G297400v4 [Glycine max]|uniref:Micronuclear linker histone polyprotein-like protein n=2 Tax=Glycine subgen. Soja TaxID=1462606 RepID=K7KY66_SOYBN|nr:myb-like protein X [Glycine max]XP_028238186.1 myb-like protein X [Glycine soja]KHN41153.1 hypothetical protein glysoja_017197 [Glycine soja]KRH56029.1 hypothetical protein GLYMA_06G297400v4 [Glycine max]RZC09739.1 hypothetical protein D0Y65_016182 [Glycine soja]|eukprot:XP_003526292.1 myb-like protein X [Glycine max]